MGTHSHRAFSLEAAGSGHKCEVTDTHLHTQTLYGYCYQISCHIVHLAPIPVFTAVHASTGSDQESRAIERCKLTYEKLLS